MTTPTALLSSASNEWGTPLCYIEAARRLMNGIDLDPASSHAFNIAIGARHIYRQEDDGLMHDWPGSVWLNPPYGMTDGKSNQAVWSAKLMSQYRHGVTREAVLLVNAVPSDQWFQFLLGNFICFHKGRIRFQHADGKRRSQPTHGNAFVYFGTNVRGFYDHFSPFGPIMRQVRQEEL